MSAQEFVACMACHEELFCKSCASRMRSHDSSKHAQHVLPSIGRSLSQGSC